MMFRLKFSILANLILATALVPGCQSGATPAVPEDDFLPGLDPADNDDDGQLDGAPDVIPDVGDIGGWAQNSRPS